MYSTIKLVVNILLVIMSTIGVLVLLFSHNMAARQMYIDLGATFGLLWSVQEAVIYVIKYFAARELNKLKNNNQKYA